MQIHELLAGQWYQFSGGSRPGSTGIRFLKRGRVVVIELFYVFDSMTGESELFQWTLPAKAFDRLARGLLVEGYASFESDDDSLLFEWRPSPRGFEFKLKGRHTDPFAGSRSVEFASFREVPCGVLIGGNENGG